ncbi:MAG: tetratricopeptide repeat protein [Candidatus Helarchaeota archaeon]|nr:tetratricopeptide repeat protein [Candidatus Helarchaeota archaeon]
MINKIKKSILGIKFLLGFVILILILFGESFVYKHEISDGLYAGENNSYNSRAMEHYVEGIIYDMKEEYAAAILEYQDAVRYDPNVPIFYLSLAEDYYYLRKDERAMLMFEKYLQLKPDDYDVGRTLLMKLYLPRGKYQKAEKLVESMLKNIGQITPLKLLLTDLYLRNKNIDKAVLNSSYYLGNPSVNPNVYKHIADSFIKTKNTDVGIAVFERFLDKFKDNDKLYYGLGLLYLAEKDTSRVIELYEKGIKLNKDTKYIKEELCDLYISMNNLEKAKALFDDVGTESKIKIADAYFLARKDEEAESMFDRIKNETEDILLYFRLGEIKYNNKKYQEAVKNFLKAVEIDSSVSETYFRLALSYFRLKRYDQALESVNNGLRINPEELRFLNLKADIVYNMGDFHKTEAIYDEIFKIDPEYDIALNNYSYILAERGEKLDKALEMSKRAVKKKPRNGSYLDTLGWIYYKLNQYEEALKYMKEAADITEKESEPHPVILEHLGDIYLKLGDIKNAKYYWKKALEIDKDNKNLLKKIEEN